MSTMQGFYQNLVSAPGGLRPYLDALARLTRVSLREIEVLRSNVTWDLWDSPGV